MGGCFLWGCRGMWCPSGKKLVWVSLGSAASELGATAWQRGQGLCWGGRTPGEGAAVPPPQVPAPLPCAGTFPGPRGDAAAAS